MVGLWPPSVGIAEGTFLCPLYISPLKMYSVHMSRAVFDVYGQERGRRAEDFSVHGSCRKNGDAIWQPP